MMLTFGLTAFTWIFFRANNIEHAINYISEIFSSSLFAIPQFIHGEALTTILLTTSFIVIEWFGREHQYAIERIGLKINRPLRYVAYYAIILAIFWFGGKEQAFIYFQF